MTSVWAQATPLTYRGRQCTNLVVAEVQVHQGMALAEELGVHIQRNMGVRQHERCQVPARHATYVAYARCSYQLKQLGDRGKHAGDKVIMFPEPLQVLDASCSIGGRVELLNQRNYSAVPGCQHLAFIYSG
jgi:hypothetical protein